MKFFLATVILAGLISMACGATLVSQEAECEPGMGAEVGRRFAYEFYQTAIAESESEKNVFLAPTTVVSALAMILAGARGKTKDQIWNGMMFESTSRNFTEDDLPCLLSRYGDRLMEDDRNVATANPLALLTASKLFGERTYEFADSFITKTASYGGQMEEVDFRQAPEATRQHINEWTAQVTQDKIQDLFGKGDITSDTALAVVSAIYFKGLWKTDFKPRFTRTGDFMVTPRRAVRAEFMAATSKFRMSYSRKLNAQLLELPYQEDVRGRYNVSMIIVLPSYRAGSMDSLEQKLTEENLGPAISDLFKARPFNVRLSLPKFKLTGEYKLQTLLESMGITYIFTPGVADLSAMRASSSTDRRPLYVSSAVHKTFIEVDEKGTEAAGATGFGIVAMSLPPSFVCDRPFLTMIYEKNSDSILFIGRVNDPTAE